jgi:hypothetical protein
MSLLNRKRKRGAESSSEAGAGTKTGAEPAVGPLSAPPPETYSGFKAGDGAPRCYLSNLFGGAEFVYMAQRFEGRPREGSRRLAALLRALAAVDFDADYERFQTYRFRITGKRTDAYLKEGRVAAGVLATLINGCFRKSMAKRLAVVNNIANEMGVSGAPMSREDFFIDDDAALAEQKKEWMRRAHRVKFAKPFYFALLRDAHPGWLFEREHGRRDANSNWAGRDGWMAEVLQQAKLWVQEGGVAEGGKGASKVQHTIRF